MTMREKLRLLETRRAESELGGGAARLKAQHDKGKLSARERLDVLLDEGSFVELDRFVTHRSSDFGLDEQLHLRRRRRHRSRPNRGPPGLRLLAGLHRVRGLAVRGVRREDLQDHGPGGAKRRAGDRSQRLRRRAHSGRRGLARRLRRDLPAQHARVGRRPADLGHPRSVRRAAPCIRRRSPTSRSWCAASRTCSSPAPTS